MLNVAYKTLVFREVKRFLNVYNQTLIAPIVSSFLYFTIFTVIFASKQSISFDYKVFIASGITIMSILQNAYANTQSTMTTAKVLGFSIDTAIAPISNLTLTLAFLTGGLIRGLSIGVISIVVFAFFVDFPFYNPVIALLYAILATILFSLIGIIVGSLAKSFDSSASFNTYVILPLTLLSGTFYSVKMLPPFWQNIIAFNPIFYVIDGFRFGILGFSESSFNPLFPIIILASWVIGLSFVAYFMVKKYYYET
jgi:ABC-2 type transport system permease protein